MLKVFQSGPMQEYTLHWQGVITVIALTGNVITVTIALLLLQPGVAS